MLAAGSLSLEANGGMWSGHVVLLFGLKSLFQLLVHDFERVISPQRFTKETRTPVKLVAGRRGSGRRELTSSDVSPLEAEEAG